MDRLNRPRARWVAIVAILTLAAGCASTPERVAYNTIDAAVVSVQGAMRGFNEFYQAGKATEADRTKVLAAYTKFQKTADVAIAATQGLAQPGADVIQIVGTAASEVLLLVAQIKAGR